MRILIGLLMILAGSFMYIIGQTSENPWKIKSNKAYKWMMGIPIGLIWMFSGHYWLALLTMLTYFIATQFGYGENNWLTKLIGKMNAIIFCGVLLGLASFPIIGYWAILSGLISGYTFYYLEKKNGIINEPWVAILRGIGGTICLL